MNEFDAVHAKSKMMARYLNARVDGMAFVLVVSEPAPPGVTKKAFYIANIRGKANVAATLEEMAADIRREIRADDAGRTLH